MDPIAIFREYIESLRGGKPPQIEEKTEKPVIRVSQLLECPFKESFSTMTRTARISDGVLLDEELKAHFIVEGLFKGKQFQSDVELKREILDIVIVGHPDLMSDDVIIDIKHTSTIMNRYPREEIITDLELPERYIDQVRIYKWLAGNKHRGYLMGRVVVNYFNKKLDRWFIKEVEGEYTDEDILKLLQRVPRYDYECKYCRLREECPYSKYTPEPDSRHELERIALELGYDKIKKYKGWYKYFGRHKGLVYSDGHLWEVSYLGAAKDLLA